MAVSISAKGKTLHDDMEHGLQAQWNSNYGTLPDKRRQAAQQAINALIAAMDVDGNQTHNTSFTIALTLTSNSATLQIS